MNARNEINRTQIRIKKLKEIKKQLEIEKNKTLDLNEDLVFDEIIHEINNKLQVAYDYLSLLIKE